MITHHAALIYTMVLVSASDRQMTDAELKVMGTSVKSLPVFRGFDSAGLTRIAEDCAALLDQEEGLARALDLIRAALPVKLRETAYALACDVAVADGHVEQEELRMLELVRHRLDVDRLTAAAIERGAKARAVAA
ncbi:tellurite resistance TerB family protein [Oleispirillum naphthae]|uniref:tellurite resistance TerB family protein n=1 Tax=Oleispirillum naphthae TaxID=2838853 RepID=UPI0030826B8A